MNRIALVMIARDEARCIERSLLSAKPFVDEMVVLDTGSVDATARLATACGARVGHFKWVDDFSVARNVALAMTDAPWRLVMDADEWIEAQGAETFAALRAQDSNFVGQVRVSSEFDQTTHSIERAPSWLSRVLPEGVTYCGRVHEQPESDLRRLRLPLVLGHDGYRAHQMFAKADRNAQLLRLALQSQPGDPYLQYQLGKDFEVQGAFGEAASWYDKALAQAALSAPWRHDLVLRTLFTLKKIRSFEAALNLALCEQLRWSDSPDFFFTLGDLFLDWAHFDESLASRLLPMIESSWLQAIDIGERSELADTVQGRGSFLAAHNLVVMYESLGQQALAQTWREREALMRAGVAENQGQRGSHMGLP